MFNGILLMFSAENYQHHSASQCLTLICQLLKRNNRNYGQSARKTFGTEKHLDEGSWRNLFTQINT